MAIYSHHAGLPGVLTPDGQKQFFYTLASGSDLSESSDEIEYSLKEFRGLGEIDYLFKEVVFEWKKYKRT